MRVMVLGASGFVGKHLVDALRRRGDEVATASLRDPQAAAASGAPYDVVVNLAGEPIAQRWNAEVKAKIESSRVESPRRFLAALGGLDRQVKAYVSASAIGYYGTSETATFDEESAPGNDFLAGVCVKWEAEALKARELGLRVALVRTGLALGRDGGALPKLLPPFQLGIGGIVGNGRQWYSWIHIDDLVGIYLMAIDGTFNGTLDGVLDGTAPNPTTNAEFTKTFGEVLKRPTIFPVPTIALRMMLGEGADVVLLGQRVLPKRTLESGYTFDFPDLRGALANLT